MRSVRKVQLIQTSPITKNGPGIFELRTVEGVLLCDIQKFYGVGEALQWARVWISSWGDVAIEFKGYENETN